MELFVSAFIVALGIGSALVVLPAFIEIVFLMLAIVGDATMELFERGN